VRAFKTPRELDIIANGFRATERALHTTFAAVKIGDDEHSLVRRLTDEIMLSGADSVSFTHINAGPNTGFPHAAPTGYRVQPGDIVKADCGGLYRGYPSNIGRTARMGPPTPEERDTWKRLREIHHEVADLLRPGNTGKQLFARATTLHEKHGIPFPYAHNGHSVGLEIHEHPIISPHDDRIYEAGMISTVETRVRWVGVKGLHMEDLYLITEAGPQLLTTAFDNEEIMVI
jgi:Xaa-Pro aminopeptidase